MRGLRAGAAGAGGGGAACRALPRSAEWLDGWFMERRGGGSCAWEVQPWGWAAVAGVALLLGVLVVLIVWLWRHRGAVEAEASAEALVAGAARGGSAEPSPGAGEEEVRGAGCLGWLRGPAERAGPAGGGARGADALPGAGVPGGGGRGAPRGRRGTSAAADVRGSPAGRVFAARDGDGPVDGVSAGRRCSLHQEAPPADGQGGGPAVRCRPGSAGVRAGPQVQTDRADGRRGPGGHAPRSPPHAGTAEPEGWGGEGSLRVPQGPFGLAEPLRAPRGRTRSPENGAVTAPALRGSVAAEEVPLHFFPGGQRLC